ncbi:MAG: CvpA family protein [Firmicutes bacterium]|nr:CvpA family protein [Bacillota bacterium]
MSEVLEFSESVGSNAAVNSHFGLIVDIAVALIFLLFAVWHARKGFYKTFAGIIAVVVAIAIGIIGAGYLTPPVMEKAWPKVEETVVENYDSSVGHTVAELHDLVGSGAEKLLKITHLEEKAENILDESKAVSWTEAPKAKLLELVHKALREVVHAALFIVITLLGLLLFKPINALVDKINDAPVLKQLDWLGGFVIGLLECLAVFFIVIKICEMRDVSFFRDIQEGSWFVTKLLGL